MLELLDIVDENGQPTGRVIDRQTAHEKGICHRTSHVWILRLKNGRTEVLLQKRSDTKDSNPGCYDISSAGHVPAGEEYADSAVRELKEELGVEIDKNMLHYCGQRRIKKEAVFYGKPFLDNQVSNVYYIWLTEGYSAFSLQQSEVASVIWIELTKCKKAVRDSLFKHCISSEELELLPDIKKEKNVYKAVSDKNISIEVKSLPEETYKGLPLYFDYESKGYYDLTVKDMSFKFVYRDFDGILRKSFSDMLFGEWLEKPESFGAAENGVLKGIIEGSAESWNKRYRISNFLIFKQYRGLGLGRILMKYMLNHAKASGARMAVLETQSCNVGAIAFYRKMGFEIIGFDTCAYSNEDIQRKEIRIEMGLKL